MKISLCQLPGKGDIKTFGKNKWIPYLLVINLQSGGRESSKSHSSGRSTCKSVPLDVSRSGGIVFSCKSIFFLIQ